MVQTVQHIIVIPQLQFVARWSMSLLWTFMCRKLRKFRSFSSSLRVLHPCRGAMVFLPWSRLCCGTIQIPQSLVDKVVAASVLQVAGLSGIAGRRLSCRDTEAHPHGLSDHRDSPVARGHVVDAPVLPVVPVARVSQVLVVKITAVIRQLQHIEKTCVDKVVFMLCFVLFLWILAFTLSLVSDTSTSSRKVLFINCISPRTAQYQVQSSFLLVVVVRRCPVIVHSICIPNSCIFSSRKRVF